MAYLSFTDAAIEFNRDIAKRNNNAKYLECADMRLALSNRAKVRMIQNFLVQHGQNKVEYISNGSEAVAFRGEDGNVIRIDAIPTPATKQAETSLTETNPFRLEPDTVGILNKIGLRIEILPYAESLHSLVKRGAIERDNAKRIFWQLYLAADEKGYHLGDLFTNGIRIDNVGLLPDGKPIIIDRGSRITKTADLAERGRETHDRLIAKAKEETSSYPGPDWRWDMPTAAPTIVETGTPAERPRVLVAQNLKKKSKIALLWRRAT